MPEELPGHPVLQTLQAQQAPASHLVRIQALMALAARSPACVGLVLVGSYAKGTGDRVSDLDLVAFVREGAAQEFLRSADAVLDNGEVLHSYGGDQGARGAFRKLVYLDFASCELHAFNLPTDFVLRRPYIVLWDPQNCVAGLVGAGDPIRHEDFEPYPHGDDGLSDYPAVAWCSGFFAIRNSSEPGARDQRQHREAAAVVAGQVGQHAGHHRPRDLAQRDDHGRQAHDHADRVAPEVVGPHGLHERPAHPPGHAVQHRKGGHGRVRGVGQQQQAGHVAEHAQRRDKRFSKRSPMVALSSMPTTWPWSGP
jgi:hypothetical protein